MPKKNVPGPSALASTNFSAVEEPGRTLKTNGELALPTISTPPGATVILSGCDFASAIRISAADAACATLMSRAMQVARRRAFERHIVRSPWTDLVLEEMAIICWLTQILEIGA